MPIAIKWRQDDLIPIIMKRKSMILGAILCVALTVVFVACSKTHNCECLLGWNYTGETHTISMGEVEKECSSITFSDIVSHVGGDATGASEYRWSCYEK
ncbi:MAG: hypothetical protein IJU19_04815 [Bacteroidales bacterium]|nr:hypothetical protein [Bacteroidales bacterium]